MAIELHVSKFNINVNSNSQISLLIVCLLLLRKKIPFSLTSRYNS